MILAWIEAFIGMAISFLSKYVNRKDKKSFDLNFWIADNWPELAQSFLGVMAVMFMLGSNDTVFDNEKFDLWIRGLIPWIPSGVVLPVRLAIPLLLGLVITDIIYWFNKQKSKRARKLMDEENKPNG